MFKKYMSAGILAAILLILSYSSCTHPEQVNLQLQPQVCFTTEVLPLFQTNCALSGCHDAASARGELVFDSYEHILAGGIVPYKSEKSPVYKSLLKPLLFEGHMPPGGVLSKEQRMLIQVWIDQGARNSNCNDTTGGNDTTGTKKCFENDVLPIFLSNCAQSGCHDASTATKGYVLNSYTNIMKDGIKAAEPANSELYKVLVTTEADDRMPPSSNAPLSEQDIQTIYNWINEGALNSACTANCDTNVFTFAAAVAPIVNTNCKGCHNSTNASGGVTLENYSDVKTYADNGALLNVLKATNGYPQMPTSGKLSDCKIRQIQKWINYGSLNN